MTTLRQWNPERLDVPWGEANGSDEDSTDCCPGCYCCCICSCIQKIFLTVFQEVIHVVELGNLSMKAVVKLLHERNKMTSSFFRILTWFTMCGGIYLLFSPIIAMFKWIPLIGWLLGGVIQIAAAVFALILGSIFHMLTLALAWIYYRPLFGLLLLTGVGLLITLLFTVGK